MQVDTIPNKYPLQNWLFIIISYNLFNNTVAQVSTTSEVGQYWTSHAVNVHSAKVSEA